MDTVEYIKELVSIPSPSGFTQNVMSYIKEEVEKLGYEGKKTNKGGVIVEVNGKDSSKARMVTAHLDTLGAMVKEIKEDGRLKLDKVGGFAFNSIEGENCLIHTSTGKTYSGTILIHQSSVHVYEDTNTAERNASNMEVRIDEVVKSKGDTENLGISVGDFISFNPRVLVTDSGFIKSRHLDDKASGGILLNTLKVLKEEKISLPYKTYFYFSNNEEIGYGANSSIPENVAEFLAVDMGALGDGQASDEYTVSICAKDSSGPYNYEMRNYLVNLAKNNSIDYKVDIYPYYGSDASAALRAGADIKHGLIGPGVESSHSYERTHESSVMNTEKLLMEYIKSDLI